MARDHNCSCHSEGTRPASEKSDTSASSRARAIKKKLRSEGRTFSDSTEIIRAGREVRDERT